VKFPYPTLARLMSGRSAIVEPGDGELTIPPVLQPVTEVFSPLINLRIPPALGEDTQMMFEAFVATGIAAQQRTDFPTFAAGRWNITFIRGFRFTGTANLSSAGSISLLDPDGLLRRIDDFRFSSGFVATTNYTLPLLFTRPGWSITHILDATVAGDSVFDSICFYARRVF